jgi:folate-dependent phosphoribosylglycinamide formyltransferase PurN
LSNEQRVVVLTNGNEYADRVLEALGLAGVVPEAVLFVQDAPHREAQRSSFQRAARVLRDRGPAQLTAAALRAGLQAVSPDETSQASPLERWRGFARRVESVGVINGQEMVRTLRDISPDYAVLGGLGIIKGPVLKCMRAGTFNAHPGLLPFCRGLGVVPQAIRRDVPVGVTGHFVDAGIDTGAVLIRRLVPVTASDTLHSLRQKAYAVCVQVMVELVVKACRGESLEGVRQTRRFPYCKAPSAELLAEIDATIREGKARDIYERWRRAFDSDQLPAEDVETPPISVAALDSGTT